MTPTLWRMGDDELPDICADVDALLAKRLMDGIDDQELDLIGTLFVNLHGSSAWGRLREMIHWSDDAWYFSAYKRSGRWTPVTAEDIKTASSMLVEDDD